MIISVDTRIPFRVLAHATYRDKLVEPCLLAECATNRGQVVPRGGRLIHFMNEWHGGGVRPVVARRNQRGDARGPRFATWNESEFDCVAHRDTRIHRGGPLRRKEPLLEDGSGTLIESRRTHDQHEADQGDTAAAWVQGTQLRIS